MSSAKTCFHAADESPARAVTSGVKKSPPPQLAPAKNPLAGAWVLAVSMTALLP
jgi:hypothetical protein